MSVALFLRTESSVSGFRMDERTSERACRERAIREIAGHVRPRILAIDQKCEHTALVMLVCIHTVYSASCLNNGITRASPHSFVILGALACTMRGSIHATGGGARTLLLNTFVHVHGVCRFPCGFLPLLVCVIWSRARFQISGSMRKRNIGTVRRVNTCSHASTSWCNCALRQHQ